MPDATFDRLLQELAEFDEAHPEICFDLNRDVDRDGKALRESFYTEPEGLEALWQNCVPFLGKMARNGKFAFFAERIRMVENAGHQKGTVREPGRLLSQSLLNNEVLEISPAPHRATRDDLNRVSKLAGFLALNFKKVAADANHYRSLWEKPYRQRSAEEHSLEPDLISARVWLERCQEEARFVVHYVKNLLPADWQDCCELHSKRWATLWGDEVEWDLLSQELHLIEAHFSQLSNEKQSDAAENADRWMKFVDAEQISGINRGNINRAADRREIEDNGLKGRDRRIDRASFTRWQEQQAKRPERAESAEAVNKMLSRATKR